MTDRLKKKKKNRGRTYVRTIYPRATRSRADSAGRPDEMALFQRGEGARFTGKTDPVMEKFNNSLNVDRVMWMADIDGSIAYSQCIEASGVLSAEEGTSIRSGLEKVRAEWAAGTFVVKEGDEDIHTANERRLTELIGPAGGKVHTGRSRNDQVVRVRVRVRVRLRLRLTSALVGSRCRIEVNSAAHSASALCAAAYRRSISSFSSLG